MRAAAALLAVALAAACIPPQGGWDLRALEAEHPALRAQRGHRLGDATPYLMPEASGRGLQLFLCRWEVERALRVSLPDDATASERDAIRLALAAWQGAGLGLRFDPSPAAGQPVDIALRFADPEGESVPDGMGDTIADCSLREGFATPGAARRVAAELRFASIELNRVLHDAAGRPAELSPEQIVGAWLHELGHALGYPGHAVARDSVMAAAPGEVRRAGARVLAGESFHDPTLAALYALPSGTVVGHLAVAASELEPLFQFARVARSRAWEGPFVRVGDRSARFLWREPNGRAAGSFVVRHWRRVLGHPERFELLPTPRAVAALRGATFRPGQ